MPSIPEGLSIAPLYHNQGDTNNQSNFNWTTNYLIEQHRVPPHKILMLLQSLVTSQDIWSQDADGSKTYGLSKKDFYEVCNEIKKDKWTVVHNTNGSFAYHGNLWTSYLDVEEVQIRAEYVRQMNLGGGAIGSLSGDDFQEVCGCGKYPLLTALAQVLRNDSGPRRKNCT